MLDFYKSHSAATDPGRYAFLYESIPDDMETRFAIVWGTTLHQWHVDHDGVPVRPNQLKTITYNGMESLLAEIHKRDPRPLTMHRDEPERIVVTCVHKAVFLNSLLRHAGYSARERFGFARYLNGSRPGRFRGHAISETWNATHRCWVRMDVDCLRMKLSSDEFLTAVEAWQHCRSGCDHPERFMDRQRTGGMARVRKTLLKDLAALAKQPFNINEKRGTRVPLFCKPDSELTKNELRLLDQLADLASRSDPGAFHELREIYSRNVTLQAPDFRKEPLLWASGVDSDGWAGREMAFPAPRRWNVRTIVLHVEFPTWSNVEEMELDISLSGYALERRTLTPGFYQLQISLPADYEISKEVVVSCSTDFSMPGEQRRRSLRIMELQYLERSR